MGPTSCHPLAPLLTLHPHRLRDASGFTFDAFMGTGPKAMHSIFCFVALLVILIVLPYFQYRRALRDGVLTPRELFSLLVGDLTDSTFAHTVRISVGVHHQTTPEFFRPEGELPLSDDDGAVFAAPRVVVLPKTLPAGAMYEPISSINLLALSSHGTQRVHIAESSSVTAMENSVLSEISPEVSEDPAPGEDKEAVPPP